MAARDRKKRLGRTLMESGLALIVGGGIYAIWPLVALPRLGREDIWFGLAWLVLLGLPIGLEGLIRTKPEENIPQTLQANVCAYAAFLFAGLFMVFLITGAALGNYKLWLGIVYLGGITLRLAGMTLTLRAFILAHPHRILAASGAAFAISSLAGLLLIPWTHPGLVVSWPPAMADLIPLISAALLWGGISGALLLGLRLWGGSRRLTWLVYLALGLGFGPALAVAWFNLTHLLLAFLIITGLVILHRITRPSLPAPLDESARPLTLYWLLRAIMLLWWGCGGVVALSSAWWGPDMGTLFTESIWLRALTLGGFLVVCVGILAEYSLPLLGRSGLLGLGKERKRLGVVLTALALMAAFVPFLLVKPDLPGKTSLDYFDRARAELLPAPVVLDPENAQIELSVPVWLTGITHLFVISHLLDGAEVPQGATVAQAVAQDIADIPYIFNLRAGIDTSEADLDQRSVAIAGNHRPSRVASNHMVYTLVGEAHLRNDYYTGLYLGRKVPRLKSVRLRLVYKSLRQGPPVKMKVLRVFAY